MASLTPKVLKGRTYYYARECQRVDGKPTIVKTIYLGSLDHIVQSVTQAQQPLRPQTARLASFGDVAALFDQARKIGLVELIDAQVPKRDQGLSAGQYLLLAAINRAAHPSSKAQLAHWYHHTILPRLLPAATDQLSSQAFWNHLDHVSEARELARLPADQLDAVDGAGRGESALRHGGHAGGGEDAVHQLAVARHPRQVHRLPDLYIREQHALHRVGDREAMARACGAVPRHKLAPLSRRKQGIRG